MKKTPRHIPNWRTGDHPGTCQAGKFGADFVNLAKCRFCKNWKLLQRQQNCYVNKMCIYTGKSTGERGCGKTCGDCGKVFVFHRENGKTGKFHSFLWCIKMCINRRIMTGKPFYVACIKQVTKGRFLEKKLIKHRKCHKRARAGGKTPIQIL